MMFLHRPTIYRTIVYILIACFTSHIPAIPALRRHAAMRAEYRMYDVRVCTNMHEYVCMSVCPRCLLRTQAVSCILSSSPQEL